jgi:hypothetical protein
MASEKKADAMDVQEFLKEQCSVPHPKTLMEPGTLIVILLTDRKSVV